MTWFPKQRVVVPIDFSAESFGALDVALQLVELPNQVSIVHVIQDIAPLEAGEVWGVVDPTARIESARKALQERLTAEKYSAVTLEVILGDPAHGIADFAEQNKAQLIVIPSHGLRGLTRLLMGSTAERVVRLAHCPVLVLRQ
ncbi:universal stress protein [Anatilimnocola floriformis]|uniref:universal stress protein n=1 Tax=Anatilimnocola floriformis TaxID=2948575 RepID=UPI0020C3E3F7|nr:universal stress protein [Anatilimnocola floriformis]